VLELTREAALVSGATFRPFLVYGLICALYFVVCFPLMSASRVLERRVALGQ
jgi:polar amino acid transport system permease protein